MDIADRFNRFDGEYLNFDGVEEKRSHRPDLHAFLFLDDLFPNPERDMIAAAEHDEFWLDVDGEKIATLTDDQIIELVRCGVRYDKDVDSLAMFT